MVDLLPKEIGDMSGNVGVEFVLAAVHEDTFLFGVAV